MSYHTSLFSVHMKIFFVLFLMGRCSGTYIVFSCCLHNLEGMVCGATCMVQVYKKGTAVGWRKSNIKRINSWRIYFLNCLEKKPSIKIDKIMINSPKFYFVI
jgi:hypothetical protein